MTDCNHNWQWVSDWYGDPNVINGTADCSHWECSKCGAMHTNSRHKRPEPEAGAGGEES